MASIIKRNSSYSVVYYYNDTTGIKKQKWETYKTLEDAQRRKHIVEDSAFSYSAPLFLFTDLVQEFIEYYGKIKWSYSTFSNNYNILENSILPHIGDIPLSSFSPRLLNQYYASVRQDSTPNKLVKIHKLLKSIFKQAVVWQCIDSNPTDYIIAPTAISEERNILTIEQIKFLLAHCENDTILSLSIQLSFACSLRKGEISALTWEDSDFDNATVQVNKELARINRNLISVLGEKEIVYIFPDRTKELLKTCHVLKTPKTQSSNRIVYIPQSLLSQLALYKQCLLQSKNKMDYKLIFSDQYGYPFNENFINSRFRKHLKQFNLPHVVFHSLRHSSVTYKLLITNGDIKSVQGDTGHSQLNMITNVYSHIIDRHRKKTAQDFEQLFYQKVRPPFISN